MCLDDDWTEGSLQFLRLSGNGRITLVLDKSASPISFPWAMMTPTEIPEAVTALRCREGISAMSEARYIGVWRVGDPSPQLIPNLVEWAAERNLDVVVWTNLGQKFNDEPRAPNVDEVVSCLTGLKGRARQDAEKYIRKAPVDTAYRRKILAAFE